MIVIRHKETGEPLLEVAADTLAGADLEGAMLLCADLKGADLRGAHLRVVDLCQADLRGATLDEADLRDADATLANLVGATLRGADLTDARFQGINMGTDVPALTDFTGAELTRTYLNFSTLRRCTFADAKMRGVDLTRCDLSDSVLVGADLSGSNFSNSNLRGCNLSYTMLAGAVLNDVDLRGANLQHAELVTATLSGVRLAQAALSHAHLSRTVFARCHDLHEALGLDSLEHLSPSSIDMESLRACLGGLTDDFLEAVGVEPREIEALRGWLRQSPSRGLHGGQAAREPSPADQPARRAASASA
jgi:uncharacterized protein YjbI with pentapeptide repeats